MPSPIRVLTPRLARGSATEQPQLTPLGVFILLMGAFLPITDFFIINVALPSISATLHASGAALATALGVQIGLVVLLAAGTRALPRFTQTRSST